MRKDIRDYTKNGVQYSYVLDNLLTCGENDEERLLEFFACYNAEYNHEYNQVRYPNEQERLANYLQGLPSCMHIEYEYYKIIEVGKSWGYCTTERKENEFINRWFSVIALRLLQLRAYYYSLY